MSYSLLQYKLCIFITRPWKQIIPEFIILSNIAISPTFNRTCKLLGY